MAKILRKLRRQFGFSEVRNIGLISLAIFLFIVLSGAEYFRYSHPLYCLIALSCIAVAILLGVSLWYVIYVIGSH